MTKCTQSQLPRTTTLPKYQLRRPSSDNCCSEALRDATPDDQARTLASSYLRLLSRAVNSRSRPSSTRASPVCARSSGSPRTSVTFSKRNMHRRRLCQAELRTDKLHLTSHIPKRRKPGPVQSGTRRPAHACSECYLRRVIARATPPEQGPASSAPAEALTPWRSAPHYSISRGAARARRSPCWTYRADPDVGSSVLCIELGSGAGVGAGAICVMNCSCEEGYVA